MSLQDDNFRLIIYKLCILILILCLTFYFAYLPLKFHKLSKNNKLMGMANAFSGGIFLSISLLHLMPESSDLFHHYFLKYNESDSKNHSHFPYSYFLAFCGYTLMLFIEKIIFASSHTHDKHDSNNDSEKNNFVQDVKVYNISNNYHHNLEDIVEEINTEDNNYKYSSTLPFVKSDAKTYVRSKEKYFTLKSGRSNFATDFDNKRNEEITDYVNNIAKKDEDKKENKFKKFFTSKGKFTSLAKEKFKSFRIKKEFNEDLNKVYDIKRRVFDELFEETRPSISQKELLLQKEDNVIFNKNNITSFLLLLALSVHAFFEGIALGLLEEDREVFFMLIAISFHKWVEALTIGISLSKSMIDKEVLFFLILLFSLTTPLGILVGLVLSGVSKIFEAVFLSISAGTFLYISASEVVIEEFSVSQYKIQKFLGFLLGSLFILLFTIFEFLH